MPESEETNDEIHDQRTENEIKKIILSLEHGENFVKPIERDLPPEVEGKWLDYVQKFEEEFSKRKRILIYDLVGRPEFRKVNEIADSEIKSELDSIMQLLQSKAITVDTICPVDDRELYRFITEELIKEEINDLQIEGMTTGFIYEEFHPNHEYDIKNRCIDFVNHILNKKREWMPDYLGLADTISSRTGPISGKQVIEKIGYFRDAFSLFTIHNISIDAINIAEDKSTAEVECNISYSGNVEGGNELMTFSGIGTFSLKNDHDWWDICRLDIPGISI